MQPKGRTVLVAAIVLTTIRPAAAQDLLERNRARGSVQSAASVYQGYDRLDLRVGGSFPTPTERDRGHARIGLSAGIETDFACGRFDVKANLKSLVGKEARDDLLDALIGAIESELLYNAMVLLCEASPTTCQAYQHFRGNANAMLGIGYDRCQAIEAGVQDGVQSARAKALKDCIAEKERQGATMDQALAACNRANSMSGLTGGKVAEFDLGKELEKALGLAPGESQEMERLLSSVRVRPSGVTGEIKTDQVLAEYAKLEKEYLEAWTKATGELARNPDAQVDPDAARKLQPGNTPGPLPLNLRDIADLPADQRAIYIRWLASLAALQTLEERIAKLERYLLAATQVPQTDAGTVQRIEREIVSLRTQMRHVDDYVRRQEAHNQALLRVIQAAEARKRELAASSVARAKSAEETRRVMEEYSLKVGQPYRPKAPPAPLPPGQGAIQGRGCTNCPGEVRR
jgi:hypothetical protein